MSIQAIAFDLDDTLLRADGTVSEYTVSVLRACRERGILIFPASGRTRDSMWPTVERIGCAEAFISCNGGNIWTPDRQLLTEELLPVEAAHQIARFAREHSVYCQTYSPSRFFYSMENEYAPAYARMSSLKGEYVGDLEAFIQQPVTKLLMMDSVERIAELYAKCREQFGHIAAVTCSKAYFLECNPLRATKGNALTWCAAHFGFDMANLLAFGDSLNDLSMLEAAGTGVCMGNAREDVKALGFPVCATNDEDGVARYIEANVLNH